MQTFIVLFAFVAASLAFPVDEAQVYLSEDTNGNYKLNYVSKTASRDEQRSADGSVLGSYSYVDNEGIHHKITYVAAEEEGFNAQGADIPLPVPETPEIIQSRAEHFTLVAQDKALNPIEEPEKPINVHEVLSKLVVPEIASLPASAVPAEDHEILQAKSILLSEYATALSRLSEEYRRVKSF